MFTLVSLLQQDASLWDGIPLDPASVFVYFLLFVSGIAIWRGSRKKDG